MKHTWNDLKTLSLNEPMLTGLMHCTQLGYTVEEALIECLYWYATALQSARAQLVDAEAMRPRIYYLEMPNVCAAPMLLAAQEPVSEGEDGRLG